MTYTLTINPFTARHGAATRLTTTGGNKKRFLLTSPSVPGRLVLVSVVLTT